MDNNAADQLAELDRILFPEGVPPGGEVRQEDRLQRLKEWRKLANGARTPTQDGFEIRLLSVPFESRGRAAVYLRRRFGFSMQDSQRAVNSPGTILQKGLLSSEVEELRPDLETLGLVVEIVPASG